MVLRTGTGTHVKTKKFWNLQSVMNLALMTNMCVFPSKDMEFLISMKQLAGRHIGFIKCEPKILLCMRKRRITFLTREGIVNCANKLRKS